SGSNPRMGGRGFTEMLLSGTAGADRLQVKDVGNYRLEGGAGDDVLIGGGSGSHRLTGGAGNDTYLVKKASDLVIESAGGGTDSVQAYIDYWLPENVENL